MQNLFILAQELDMRLKPDLEVFDQFRYICNGNKQLKGTATVPFSFLHTRSFDEKWKVFVVKSAKFLTMEERIQQIEALISQILAEEPTYFLVSVKIKPTNNIKVFFDGDEGISIEKCVRFNRALYKMIEENGWYPEGEFSLEISSAGIGEPLLLHRQYLKNVGRDLEIIFTDDSIKIGTLMAVTAEDILIQTTEGKGKKAVTQQLLIPFNNIKSTTVQIKF